MHVVRVTALGQPGGVSHMPVMQIVLDRPRPMAERKAYQDSASKAALWVIDALADEISNDASLDETALVAALRRKAGYQQADPVAPHNTEALRAELVARLAGRLARG